MSSFRVAPLIPPTHASFYDGQHPVVAQLLYNRGVTAKDHIDDFLVPRFESRHDPFLMTDMETAVSRILTAMKRDQRIVVWSDYDCDGIPGGVLLHDFFTAVGYTNFENYIPHRHNEGFGLNTEGINALHGRGTSLIITVDCGIANVEEVSHANSLGIDVIVTDHHEPGDVLPPACAILDPKRDTSYPFRELCGTGVAWKLVEALIARGGFTLKPGEEKWWLDMVGLATMADMVPLTGENRVLAHYGLTVMRKTRRTGLIELLRKLRIDPRTLTDDDIGFSIGPRINAASRMGDPILAFRAFASRDDNEARESAARLEKVNDERKGTVAAMVKEIKRRLRERVVREVIVIGDPTWRPSLAGLAANTIAEEHQCPAFVWGRDGRGALKGSARAAGSASVIALMRGAHDAFIEYGGHHASGGFSVHEHAIHTLEDRLVNSFVTLGETKYVKEERVADAVLELEDVTLDLYRSLSALSPFGVGNDKPLFAFRGVTPERVTTFGKSGEHTKVTFARKNGTLSAIAFFKTPSSFAEALPSSGPIDLLAHVEHSQFMGRPELRLRIVEIYRAA